MPIISRIVTAIGWSPFVMQSFLTLCERVGLAYPLDQFAQQIKRRSGRAAERKRELDGKRFYRHVSPVLFNAWPTETTH